MSEEAKLRQELQDLDRRREQLDRRIADAVHKQRHGTAPAVLEEARNEERALLVEMDRLMTRTRAVEGKLLQLQKSSPH